MANRRRLDSRRHLHVVASKEAPGEGGGANHHHHHQQKQQHGHNMRLTILFFTLALVSCFLLPTKCASFGSRRSALNQLAQWRERQPDYRLYPPASALADLTAASNSNEQLLAGNRLPSVDYSHLNDYLLNGPDGLRPSADVLVMEEQRGRQQRPAAAATQYYYEPLAGSMKAGVDDDEEVDVKADRQMLDARKLAELFTGEFKQPAESNIVDDSALYQVNEPVYSKAKLVELLQPEKRVNSLSLSPSSSSSSSSSSDNSNNNNGGDARLFEYDLSPKYTDQRDSLLDSLLDKAQAELTFDQNLGRAASQQQQHATKEQQHAGIDADDNDNNNRKEAPAPEEAAKSADRHRNFTTLLEDDDDGNSNGYSDHGPTAAKSATIGDQEAAAATPRLSTDSSASEATSAQEERATTVSYGTVVNRVPQVTTNEAPGSLFQRLVGKLAGMWSYATSGWLSSTPASKTDSGSATGPTVWVREIKDTASDEEAQKRTPQQPQPAAGRIDDDDLTTDGAQANTKQSVSTLTETINSNGKQAEKASGGGGDDERGATFSEDNKAVNDKQGPRDRNSENSSRDKLVGTDDENSLLSMSSSSSLAASEDRLAPSPSLKSSAAANTVHSPDSKSEMTDDNNDVEAHSQGTINMRRSSGGSGNSLFRSAATVQADDDNESSAAAASELRAHRVNANAGEPKISLLRHSSLVLPLNSNDELLVRAASEAPHHSSSLLGKYIYAPEHHYHLSAADLTKSDLDDERMYAQTMSHRTYSRRLDDGGLYGPAQRPIYAHQRADEPLGLAVANKTNDLYFLVMVAAFCAMAMAVVLAAGLFAYRVQQSRRSATESDYPTYGVVGPSNMNGGGKCGAASFVGGYFGSTGGPGSSTPGSKAGSNKHLADNYSGTTDSGLGGGVGGGKGAVAKRVSSEQANNGASRSNFMVNQNAARMYHYQHQKQQMISSDRNSTGRHTSASDLDSEDENDDGSYTVYECPGLASAHEMEIKNPLFNDDQTP